MSDTEPRTYRPATAAPPDLSPSAHHVRGETEIPEQMEQSAREVGIIQPPIVRVEGGVFRVLDGVRRVRAAERAGIDTLDVLVADVDDAEAAALSVGANVDAWTKPVSDADEQRAMRRLVGGPERSVREWEQADDIEQAEKRLGLLNEADRIERATADLSGVGRATAEALAESFGSLEAVQDAEYRDLRDVPGVGGMRATKIQSWFDYDPDENGVVEVVNRGE